MSPRPESIKKVMDVLGDFNPSEDKIKKTLGIDEDEMRMINEEKNTVTSPAKDRIPINRKLTKKAQDTLGINLSKEKLMDVLGVDENTINCAASEESEHKENKIKLKRENSITTNKRSLQKALSKMGIDASSVKLSRTLGISKNELPNATNKESAFKSSSLHLLFFIAVGILLIALAFILKQKENILNFKNILHQQPQFNSNQHHHHHHFDN
ncbi:hypothetical protein RB653_010612 [Dictyostelium firmibasis]|uniref:Uncharacterized protein n=1 Tax=Dictyostelium firmibasis TaxID=79012 RepID=A0AAN7TU16_9MYCE